MHWGDDTEEAFSPRHPREPGGLRQDILDEIADHLACAVEREQERGGENENEDAIWRRVLDRFGNPNTVARRLWWDEMWETVMREWIQTGVMVVLAVALVAFMTLVVRQMNTANQAVVEALKSNAAAVSPLVTLKVKVTRGTAEGPAAEGVKINIRGNAFGGEPADIGGTTDVLGFVEYGPVQPGQYHVWLTDGVSGLESTGPQVTLFSGNDSKVFPFVAPDAIPRPVEIEFASPFSFGDNRALHAAIETVWVGDGRRWTGRAEAILDDIGAYSIDPDITDQQTVGISDTSDWAVLKGERFPLKISGDIVRVELTRIAAGATGKVEFGDKESLGYSSITRVAEGAVYRLEVSSKFVEQHADLRAEDHAKSKGIVLDDKLYHRLRDDFPEFLVDGAVRVAGGRWGLRVAGSLVNPPTNFTDTSDLFIYNTRMADLASPPREALGETTASFAALLEGPPEEVVRSSAGGRIILALNVRELDGEEFEQALQVWPVLNNIFELDWPIYETWDVSAPSNGLKPTLGANPAGSILVPDLAGLVGKGDEMFNWILFDLSENLQAVGDNVRGREFLLQWAQMETEFKSQISIVSPEARNLERENLRPMWIVLKPMDETKEIAAGQ